jgi:hypothetical protein
MIHTCLLHHHPGFYLRQRKSSHQDDRDILQGRSLANPRSNFIACVAWHSNIHERQFRQFPFERAIGDTV